MVFIKGQLVYNKQDKTILSKKEHFKHTMDVENGEKTTPVELEIWLSDPEPLGQYNDIMFFFELQIATFVTENRFIRPAEIFYLNPVDDTLTVTTTVV